VYSVEVDGGAKATASITNLSATTDTFTWERQIIRSNFSSGCELTLADPFAHYILSFTAQRTFWLSPNETGPLDMELFDFDNTGCCALMHLKITKLGNPADTTTVVYHMRECQASGTVDLANQQVRVFPNPVQDVFSLQNAENVGAIRVFDTQGRLTDRFEVSETQTYSLQQLPEGAYFIVLEDQYGRVFQVTPVQKKP